MAKKKKSENQEIPPQDSNEPVSNLVEKPELTSEMIEQEVTQVFGSKEEAQKSDIQSHNKFSKFKKSHEGSES